MSLINDRKTIQRIVESYGKDDVLKYIKTINEEELFEESVSDVINITPKDIPNIIRRVINEKTFVIFKTMPGLGVMGTIERLIGKNKDVCKIYTPDDFSLNLNSNVRLEVFDILNGVKLDEKYKAFISYSIAGSTYDNGWEAARNNCGRILVTTADPKEIFSDDIASMATIFNIIPDENDWKKWAAEHPNVVFKK